MKKIIFFCLLFFSLFSEINYFAQGDNCSNALNLVNVSNYCSTSTFYTNVGATASTSPNALCWTATATEDVWFSFTAIGSSINVSADGINGSLTRPRIAIYSGTCIGLTQMACNNGSGASDLSQLITAGFTIGNTYFIRISSTPTGEGTFKLCVNNYTPPPISSSDCGGAIRLCDKNPVTATGFSGGGSNSNEPNGNSCMDFTETNSIWYYWTCVTAGTLTFDITPADNSNDIDWVLYQLNGANPCSQSGTALRCNIASCLNATGSTGINLTDISITEQAGCNPGDNAYCKFITMTAGTSYALLINNFNSFDGVTINWGGTGTFSIEPTFNSVTAICSGQTLAALPITSLNGVTGSWTPALNNTVTTTYTFSPSPGICAATVTLPITVNSSITPTFTAIAAICSGATLSALPTTSLNGITGTWSPALNNTATTTYTFTPNAGQCGTTTTLTITVNPNIVPTFATVSPICSGETLAALPTTSLNGIVGTWSPALNNTATTNYTFTAIAGICATTANLIINVNPIIAPTFTAITPICSGATLAALPTTSLNGIVGTWTPALNNTATTNYTFTATAGLCSSTATMSITVNPNLTPIITCGVGSASSVLFNWSALNGANSYDISYSVNGGIAQSGGNQTGLSFLLNGLNPADVVDLILTTNGSNCYLTGLGNCEAFDCILPAITSQATNHTACEGNPASFTVISSGGASMQWQVSLDNGLTFSNVIDAAVFSGSTTSTLSISDNTGLDGLIFQLVINEINNLCPRISNQAELIVNPYPVITALTNGPVCVGNQLDLSVNNVAGASFSWTGPNFSSFLQNPTINFTQTTYAGDYTVTSTLNGCASSSTTTLIVNAPTPVSITQVSSFCQSELPVFLTADVLGGTWSGSGITDNVLGIFDPSQADDINLISYTLSAGCGGSATSTIFVKTDPTALFSVSQTALDPYFPAVTTTNLSTNATNFIWHFDDDSISTAFETTHKYDNIPQSYTITLLAFNEAGCSDSTKIIVNIPELLLYFVPNSFTPNGDELNNTFLPVFTSGFDPFNYHLEIYNRWGELIFESFDAKIGWDGTFKELALVEDGTYVWKISFRVKSIGDSKTFMGDVTITK
jgi:gliding motility-associated-like protein